MASKKGKDAVLEPPAGEEQGDKVKTRRGEVELVGINPEGILSAAVPAPTADEPLTIVDSRLVLGYGGPIAVQSERGLFKAFTGDGLYTLSNGQRYVLPKELAEAISATLPEPNPEEVKALDEQNLSREAFLEKYPPDVDESAEAPASGGGDSDFPQL